MRARGFVPLILVSLLITGAAFGGVTVTAEDGAKHRVDAAKFAKITESAIRRAAPKEAVNVTIVIAAPEVWVGPHPIPPGTPLSEDFLPPTQNHWSGDRGRGALKTFETVRARYTITDANGAMLESVPFVFDVGRSSTLDDQMKVMRRTADYIASRVAALAK